MAFCRTLLWAIIRRMVFRGWAREWYRESWYCFGVLITSGRTGPSAAMIVLSFSFFRWSPEVGAVGLEGKQQDGIVYLPSQSLQDFLMRRGRSWYTQRVRRLMLGCCI